jgi:hypothetical protein
MQRDEFFECFLINGFLELKTPNIVYSASWQLPASLTLLLTLHCAKSLRLRVSKVSATPLPAHPSPPPPPAIDLFFQSVFIE